MRTRFYIAIALLWWCSCGAQSQTLRTSSDLSTATLSALAQASKARAEAPELEALEGWTDGSGNARGSVDGVSASNPNVFLARMIEQAVRTHPSVQAKRAEWTGTRASTDAARWQYYPTPSVLSERGANQTHKTGLTSSTTLRLQQPLWSAGRMEAGVKLAQFRELAAAKAISESQWSVALRTLDAWQSLVLAHGREQAAKKVLAQLQRLTTMMQRRVQQQVSPPVDEELAKARVVQAESDLISSQAAREAAQQRIKQWVLDWDQFEVTEPVLDAALAGSATLAPASYDDLRTQLQDAVEQSPSLLKFEADIGAAQQELVQKKSEWAPTVYARVDRQFGDYPSTGSRVADTTAYIGLQLSLGAGLSLQSSIATAAARVNSLQSERETQRRDITERYQSEWREFVSVQTRTEQARRVQQSNAGLLASYTRLFVAGRRSWLELLNALRELSQSDTALSDLQAQAHGGLYRLRLYAQQFAWQNND